jgi:hypothetical protein
LSSPCFICFGNRRNYLNKMVTVSSYTPITVNLTEVKAFCRVDGNADDALLTMLFSAAVEEFNSYTGYRLGATTVTVDTWGTRAIRSAPGSGYGYYKRNGLRRRRHPYGPSVVHRLHLC